MAWKNGNLSHTTAAQRKRVLKRDCNRCQICGRVGTEVDHIDNTRGAHYGTDSNLQLLCKACHGHKTQREASHARAMKKARLRLPQRPLPGDVL